MKICLISLFFPVYTLPLANELAKKHKVLFIIDKQEYLPFLDGQSIKKYLNPKVKLIEISNAWELEYQWQRIGRRKRIKILFQYWLIKQKIKKFRPDIIHIQEGARLFERKLIEGLNIPTVLTVHVPVKQNVGDRRRSSILENQRKSQHLATRIICQSQSTQKELELMRGIPNKKIDIIHHGLYDFYLNFRRKNIKEESRTFLIQGRMHRYKGLEIALKTAKILRNRKSKAKIIVAGEGPEFTRLLPEFKKLENIETINKFLFPQDIALLNQKVTAVLLPYLSAPQSASIPMAYAFGKPVIAFKVGGLPEQVGKGGIVIPPENPQALAEAIQKLIFNPSFYQKLRKEVKRERKKIAWPVIAQKTLRTYKEAIRIKKLPKICFVIPSAKILFDEKEKTLGGAEIQSLRIAEGLAQEGFKVDFIIKGNKKTFVKNNIHFISWQLPLRWIEKTRFNRFRYIRYIFWRVFSLRTHYRLFKILYQSKADFYYQRTASSMSSLIALFCQIFKKRFIYAVSHDSDCGGPIMMRKDWHIRKLFRWGLKKADIIIAQTQKQKELLWKNYHLKSVIIKNIYPILPFDFTQGKINRRLILWVGMLREWKRPEIFIELAKRLPEYKFVMIGGISEYYLEFGSKIIQNAKMVRNLNYLGFKPYEETQKYFVKANLYVNTSSQEGFPNTFLEAWDKSCPIVSLVDHAGAISEGNGGLVAKDFEDMTKKTEKIMENKKLKNQLGKNGRKYLEKNHNMKKIIPKYMKVFH